MDGQRSTNVFLFEKLYDKVLAFQDQFMSKQFENEAGEKYDKMSPVNGCQAKTS